MDREGLDVAALYPSIGLGIMMRDEMDAKLAAAIARAYNNWLYDFCQTDPKRLTGVAMIPLHDPNEAVKEAQRAVGKLGFIGVFARPEPLQNMPWHARYFDSLWSCLEELGVPIGFHSATAAGEVAQIGDRFGDNLLLRHVVSHPLENMVAMVDTIGGGVCERHPKLKLAFLECYCGWVSSCRMDSAMAGRFDRWQIEAVNTPAPMWIHRAKRAADDYCSATRCFSTDYPRRFNSKALDFLN
jgi:predicted TIM-barrel fold metal-dependent hydrolase